MDNLDVNKIKIVEEKDDNYPDALKIIPDRPKTLYVRGEIKKDEKCFAIVGTRRCSDYGKEIAFSIAQGLSQAGLTIVSGMARGIDTFAHKGALSNQGRTIAVLGTGLDEKTIYPQENIKLSKEILENHGCLISEYPVGSPGLRGNFPRRNRIISGLSLGVLVVEAKYKSGALITAKLAKKQEKMLFAIPGSIHALNSKGPHLLIKKGAKLVETANDILEELGLFKKTKKGTIQGKTLEQRLILDVLKQGGLHIDKVTEKTKLLPRTISIALSIMEAEGKIKNLGNNVYIINR